MLLYFRFRAAANGSWVLPSSNTSHSIGNSSLVTAATASIFGGSYIFSYYALFRYAPYSFGTSMMAYVVGTAGGAGLFYAYLNGLSAVGKNSGGPK